MQELKTLCKDLHRFRALFFVIVGSSVAIALIWWHMQSPRVAVTLTMNVTRSEAETTGEYQYHNFYRLQADERFADTVVRWLQSPNILNDIAVQSESVPQNLKAERLSSQMLRVTYRTENTKSAQKVAQSIEDRVNAESNTLNTLAQEEAWFRVIGDTPFVQDARRSFLFVLATSLALGVFLGFWTVLIRKYISL